MARLLGFLIPFAATTVPESFTQHLILAGVSGAFGVLGVTLAAYITTRRSRARIEQQITPNPPENH